MRRSTISSTGTCQVFVSGSPTRSYPFLGPGTGNSESSRFDVLSQGFEVGEPPVCPVSFGRWSGVSLRDTPGCPTPVRHPRGEVSGGPEPAPIGPPPTGRDGLT